jgi:hypothetical protein
MKIFNNLFAKAVICFSVLQSVQAQPTPPSGRRWVAVANLSDEFNGTSLDGNKWKNRHPYWNGREPSQFLSSNVSMSGGSLRLKSTVANARQQGNWINAACVTSNSKSMKKGYYSEARVKCSSLSMTTAFWFQGNYSEIDVIENFGAPTGSGFGSENTKMKTNTHYFPNGWATDQNSPWDVANISNVANNWHTYGVWWKDSRTMVYYIDGYAAATVRTKGDFNEDMYMFFDTEAFSWGIGFPTIASLNDNSKNTGFIDWVHSFKLDNAAKIGFDNQAIEEGSETSTIELFPNPAKESTTVSGLTFGDNIEIYAITGALVYKGIAQQNQETISTSFFQSGLYVVSVAGKANLKLVKE